MWRLGLRLTRAFAKKKTAGDAAMSQLEERKLRSVVANPVYGSLLGMKRYRVNDAVIYEGPANVINWEDRMIGKHTLAEVRAIAAQEGLDYVLMHEHPMTVRVMNYDNFMFKVSKDTQALSRRSKLPKGKFFSLDGYSEQESIVSAAKEAMEAAKTGTSAVEVGVMNRGDKDQLQRSLNVAEKVEQAVEKLGMGQYRTNREDFSCLFRISLHHPETETKRQNEVKAKAKLSLQVDEDEAAIVSQFTASDLPHAVLNERGMRDLDDSLGYGAEQEQEIAPEVVASLPTGTVKRRMTEEALRRALGAKLANRMLKGRVKPN
jgi:translation initiation factor IF-3